MARRIRRTVEQSRERLSNAEYAVEQNGIPVTRRSTRGNRELLAEYVRQRGGIERTSPDVARRLVDDRPFVAWDGEGYTDADNVHHYMLFGASTGHEIAAESLGTRECLELLLTVELQTPNVFHVIFAGNYDVNMFLRDLPIDKLTELKKDGQTRWGEYKLSYIKSKMFRVTKGKTTATLYDVFTFFATSFLKALDEWKVAADDDTMARIRSGKAQRSTFTFSDLPEVTDYFRSELRLLVSLCERLRENLREIGVSLSKWHGPGAVASAVLRSKKLERVALSSEIMGLSQHAYYGGRFEPFRIGTHHASVYQYDIRSAYPSAIATLPRLGGEWRQRSRVDNNIRQFGLYKVEYVAESNQRGYPHPFPWRHTSGAVFYPHTHGGTWVWGIELKAALECAPGTVRVFEGYEYDDDGERPYAWIADMYRLRAQWKEEGNQAQLALKLVMNSIYGKLAQQVGWTIATDGAPKLPQFHQLEYAGYITAHARASLYRAMMQKPESLIAVETDAVFSSEPLRLDVGNGLGQWEAKTYDGVMYVQSGMYFAREGDEWKHRTRGFSRGDVKPDQLSAYLGLLRHADDAYTLPPFSIPQTRFRTMGTSIGKPDWRTWVTSERHLSVGTPGGKREHYAPECVSCELGVGSLAECMHEMTVARSLRNVDFTQPSEKYKLEWLDGERKDWSDDDEDWEVARG